MVLDLIMSPIPSYDNTAGYTLFFFIHSASGLNEKNNRFLQPCWDIHSCQNTLITGWGCWSSEKCSACPFYKSPSNNWLERGWTHTKRNVSDPCWTGWIMISVWPALGLLIGHEVPALHHGRGGHMLHRIWKHILHYGHRRETCWRALER